MKRGDAAVEHYRLFVIGPGQSPRVYWPTREKGAFTINLPAGKCRFVIGTVHGKTQEHPLEIKPGLGRIEVTLN